MAFDDWIEKPKKVLKDVQAGYRAGKRGELIGLEGSEAFQNGYAQGRADMQNEREAKERQHRIFMRDHYRR